MVMEIKREFDETIELKDNALLKIRPDLFYEWNFEKNVKLDIYKITYGSGKKAWWNCHDCGSDYDLQIWLRTGKQLQNCPYCCGRRINQTNSLASLRPEIAKEWHPTKNDSLTPCGIAVQSNEKVWWLGECGHEWETSICNRTRKDGTRCPYCNANNPITLKGFNDIWTTNPVLAKLLANSEDGHRYTQSSNVKVGWKCSECNTIIKNRQISSINRQGLSCPVCSDGFPFGEKFLYNILKEACVEFDFQWYPSWAEGKSYDFYFSDTSLGSCIIEVHGKQHYEEVYGDWSTGRNLKEEQDNDSIKEKLAKDNGIDNFIVIDARYSTVEWIKDSILNSDIIKIIDDINFEKIGQISTNSFVKQASDLWATGTKNIFEISQALKITRNTVVEYLKKGSSIGWCTYCPKENMRQSGIASGRRSRKSTIQLTMENDFVKVWKSADEAMSVLGISHISSVCRGERKSAGGFNWAYKEDYDTYLATGSLVKRCKPYAPLVEKSVICLDNSNLNIIKTYPSVRQATIENNIKRHTYIMRCCRGERKHTGGFKWMYREDYEKMLQEELTHKEYMNKYYPKTK